MKQNLVEFETYRGSSDCRPLFLCGDALSILDQLPDDSIDFCMTSPPYWNKREYDNGGIGLEPDFGAYTQHLLAIFAQVKRVLKNTGSFWLNIGDTYQDKGLIGVGVSNFEGMGL